MGPAAPKRHMSKCSPSSHSSGAWFSFFAFLPFIRGIGCQGYTLTSKRRHLLTRDRKCTLHYSWAFPKPNLQARSRPYPQTAPTPKPTRVLDGLQNKGQQRYMFAVQRDDRFHIQSTTLASFGIVLKSSFFLPPIRIPAQSLWKEKTGRVVGILQSKLFPQTQPETQPNPTQRPCPQAHAKKQVSHPKHIPTEHRTARRFYATIELSKNSRSPAVQQAATSNHQCLEFGSHVHGLVHVGTACACLWRMRICKACATLSC